MRRPHTSTAFLRRARPLLDRIAAEATGLGADAAARAGFACELLSRLLGALFLEQLGRVAPRDPSCVHWEQLRPLLCEGPLAELCGPWPEAGAAGIADQTFAATDQLLTRWTIVAQEWPEAEAPALDPSLLGALVELRGAGRRARGRFYTPRAVVRFMCRLALGATLAARLPDEPEEALRRLLERYDPGGLGDPAAALDVLRRLRVCDPACGAGAFLLGMLRELEALRAALGDPGQAREIVAQSLWGVDLDAAGLRAARARLLLAVLAGDDRPSPPTNLLLGDGLEQLPGRFDIVIANPPYLSTKRGYARGQQAQLRAHYTTARGQFDSSALFLERAFALLEAGGCYAYLVPRPTLANSSARPLRALLEQRELLAIADLGPIFDAAVEAVVLLGRNAAPAPGPVAIYDGEAAASGLAPTRLLPLEELRTARGTWSSAGRERPDLEQARELPTIGELFRISRGAERGKRDPAIRPRGTPGTYALLRGEDVEPFRLVPKAYGLARSGDAKDKPLAVQTGRKLLVRRVASRLIAALDEEGLHTLNTLYMLTPREGCAVSLEYACAALNAPTLNALYRRLFGGDDRIFPYLRKEQLAALPLALPDAEQHARAIVLVRALHAEEQATRRAELRSELDALIAAIYAHDERSVTIAL
jgi:hypothetical protein